VDGPAHDGELLPPWARGNRIQIVVPILDDMLQKISIGATRHFHKDIAAHRFAAVGKTDLAQARARSLQLQVLPSAGGFQKRLRWQESWLVL
jgi:hypothetical protein